MTNDRPAQENAFLGNWPLPRVNTMSVPAVILGIQQVAQITDDNGR